jgi:uncharacterized membrane protein HdeD (DUF308 family)
MISTLKVAWWLILLRGIVLILLGILAFANPAGTAQALVLYSGILLLAEGVLTAVGSLVGKTGDEGRWMVLIEGLITAFFGYLICRLSVTLVLAFALIFGAWFIFSGSLKIATAIQLRKEVQGEFWMGLAGLVGIAAGVIMLMQPDVALATLMIIIGIGCLLMGAILVALALRLKSAAETIRTAISK